MQFQNFINQYKNYAHSTSHHGPMFTNTVLIERVITVLQEHNYINNYDDICFLERVQLKLSNPAIQSNKKELSYTNKSPVYKQSTKQQQKFIDKQWLPYINKLQTALRDIIYKSTNNFLLHDRMPTNHQIEEWRLECEYLTTQWYGIPNISCLYFFFHKMCEAANITHYQFNNALFKQSDDLFLATINHKQRHVLSKVYNATTLEDYYNLGGRIFSKNSPIEDLGLPDINQDDTNYLIVINFLKQVTIFLMQIEQEIYLTSINKNQSDSYAIKFLYQHAHSINNFAEIEQTVTENLLELINEIYDDYTIYNNKLDIAEYDAKFLENINPQRHIECSWQRTCPLNGISIKGDLIKIKDADKYETMKIRVNQLPYQWQHGLSVVLPQENEIITNQVKDIEKLLIEYSILNPILTTCHQLPLEQYYSMHQNVVFESSIIQTQHLHIAKNNMDNLPFFKQNHLPKWHSKLQAGIDIVPINQDNIDAFFIKITTLNPNNPKLIKLLVEYWQNLALYYAKIEIEADLYSYIATDTGNNCCIILIPVVKIINQDNSTLYNPVTDKIVTRYGIPFNLTCKPTDKPEGGFDDLVDKYSQMSLPAAHAFSVEYFEKFFDKS